MLLYTAGPYATYGNVDENIQVARDVAIRLWWRGHAVICPHLNTSHFEIDAPDLSREQFLRGDEMMIARCDGLVMLPNWEKSTGATREHEYAKSLNIPIWYAPDLPAKHITEESAPNQCRAFAETLGIMYRTHLDKNADYSSVNIMVTGLVGGVVRPWDKVARMMSLLGVNISIEENEFVDPKLATTGSWVGELDNSARTLGMYKVLFDIWDQMVAVLDKSGFKLKAKYIGFLGEKAAKHESFDDNTNDLAVYSIILRLVRSGKWGN